MCDIINSTKGAGDMENVNIVLASNILKYRKKSGLSQDELAQKLGVTFQAVSKWENAKAAPDITFLPIMADIFGCYIDELFSREVKPEIHYDHCAELPWPDDEIIRRIVYEGKKILGVNVTGNMDNTSSKIDMNYISNELKKAVPDTDSTSKLLHFVADNLSGNFEMTDENIERLLEAYRDLYKGMKK